MKHIATLFLLTLICLTASAQINRTIMNCTLGVSTEQDVIQEMSNQGYKVMKIDDETLGIDNKIKFGGQEWTVVYFNFSHSLLKAIVLMKCEITDWKIMKTSYNNLKTKLDMKYPDYLQDKEKALTPLGLQTIYSDGNTLLILKTDYMTGFGQCLSLLYADVLLQIEKEKEELNEL